MKRIILSLFLLSSIETFAYKVRPFKNSDWKEIYQKDGLVVSTYKPKNSQLVVFKAEGIIKAGIAPILANLRDVENSADWTPKLRHKSTIENVSDIEAITYNDNILPWPIDDRDTILTNKLYLDYDDNYLIVDTHSVEHKDYPSRKDRIRAIIEYGTLAMRPVSNTRTWVELVIMVDPKGLIPKWVVNIYQKSMPYDFLKALEKRAISHDLEPNEGIKKLLVELQDILNKKKTTKNKITLKSKN